MLFGMVAIAAGPGGKKKKQMTVAFYNVENLFDLEDNPDKNDNEFLPTGRYKWTAENQAVKMTNLSKAIEKLGDDDGPEILGLCEVENKAVIEELIKQPLLKKKGYEIVHHESPDQRGIDCALIYKKKVFLPLYQQAYTVKFPENPDITTRDILLVKGIIDKKIEATFIVNHWSSRRGGAEKSEWKRERAAQIVRSIVDSVQAADPYTNIVIMGDFNDEPTNRTLHQVLRAGKDSTESHATTLFNCMYKLKTDGDGTLKYRGNWNLFDQIIVSTPMILKDAQLHYKDCSADIYNPKWMRQTEQTGDWKDAPKRSHYSGSFHDDGFSDHFPVYIHLEY